MDPFSAMMGVSGLALKLGGAYFGYQGAKASNEAQQEQIKLEQQAEAVKRKYMEMDSHRKSIESVRRTQQMSALGLNNASSQMGGSAQGSSALAGGQAQVAAQGAWNQQGISQSLQTGEQLFDINDKISQQKIKGLQGQQDSLFGNALGSFGGDLIGGMGMMNQMTGGSKMGSSVWNKYSNNFMGPGSFKQGNY